jgi:hypothetical protein
MSLIARLAAGFISPVSHGLQIREPVRKAISL